MTGLVVRLSAPDAEASAPFGRFVTGPDTAGTSSFYSECLHARPDASAPMLHVNNVARSDLPLQVTKVERHPHAAQSFFPLDVSRYAVLVMPSDDAGRFLSGLRRRGSWPDHDQVAVFGSDPHTLLGTAHVRAGELIPERLLNPQEIQSLLESAA